MKTTASNPARITVNPLVYLRRGGITAPLLLVALIVSVIAFLVVKPESEKSQVRLRLIPVAMGIFNVLNGVYTLRKAKSGDLNPGVVLQENPMLIGVLADMNKGGADTENNLPTIQIVVSKLIRHIVTDASRSNGTIKFPDHDICHGANAPQKNRCVLTGRLNHRLTKCLEASRCDAEYFGRTIYPRLKSWSQN